MHFQIFYLLNFSAGDNLVSYQHVEQEQEFKTDKYSVIVTYVQQFDLNQLPEGTSNIASQSCYALADFSSRVMSSNTVLQEFYNCKNYQNEQDAINNLIGRNCIATYGSFNSYRIEEFHLNKSPKDEFFYNKKGKNVSFIQYFYEAYGVKIKDADQFMIESSVKVRQFNKETGQVEERIDTVFLVPELMFLTGMSDQQRKNHKSMQEVSKYTKLQPNQRVEYIRNIIENIVPQFKQQQIEQQIDQNEKVNLQEVQGFEAKPPKLFLSHNQEIIPNKGLFKIQQTAIKSPIFLQNNDWVIIYTKKDNYCDQIADKFLSSLKFSTKAYGITLDSPQMVSLPRMSDDQWVNNVEGYLGTLEKNIPKVVITLIDQFQSSTLYSKLKELFLKKKGIIHQNAIKDTLMAKNFSLSILGNIALQINAKLNEPLWEVERPQQVGCQTMLIGIAHYKKLLVKDRKRCVAFVSSLDENFSKYFAQASFLKPESEFIKDIKKRVTESILQYYQHNDKKCPKEIVIFRYGLGEGQIQAVTENEVKQIKRGIADFNEILEQIAKNENKQFVKFDPKIACIVINANPDQKFFYKGVQQQSQNRNARGAHGSKFDIHNPYPGSTVADVITQKNFEFYQVAQNVNQGTAKPVRYQVTYNEIDWNEETYWLLVYYQCYNYYNWQGAVRTPGVYKYAEKLATLIGDTYQGKFSSKLQNSMFYL
ncbi:Ribonuclease H-like domain [Pseudocohnilembus persalinus]|uniref:Ribonuclease H-like domain n=1 Tax=Pseudocohnilembus persalinus TaxID=266149 RepID=A0A0V0R2Z9_PSEPJ|nr:Ribonuclease H-like domain [Pseudocohnilembus persalinus]|eukprot:KRX08871.1 Ribonuclease H-like domain [Pseudocohnilembus persalinus]